MAAVSSTLTTCSIEAGFTTLVTVFVTIVAGAFALGQGSRGDEGSPEAERRRARLRAVMSAAGWVTVLFLMVDTVGIVIVSVNLSGGVTAARSVLTYDGIVLTGVLLEIGFLYALVLELVGTPIGVPTKTEPPKTPEYVG